MTNYISQKLTPPVYALFLQVKAARVNAGSKRIKFHEVVEDALNALVKSESSREEAEALQKAREHSNQAHVVEKAMDALQKQETK